MSSSRRLRSRSRKTYELVSVLAVAYFVLWGCMPTPVMPPSLPGVSSSEFGINGQVIGGVKTRTDPEPVVYVEPGGGLQIWRMFDGKVDAGILTYISWPSIGLGGVVRFPILENSWSTLGLSVSAGPIWAQAGIPMSVALSDSHWLYSEPTIARTAFHWDGLSDHPFAKIPIGHAYETKSGKRLYHELGVWLNTEEAFATPSDINGRNNRGNPLELIYYSAGIGFPR